MRRRGPRAPLLRVGDFGSYSMYALAHLGVASLFARVTSGRQPRLRIDYRIVLVGSMIADLVDKPIGFAIGISGRAAAHTGAFAVGLTLLAFAAHLRGRNGLAWFAFGHWTHLLLDGMWEDPTVLFYPGFGWAFPPASATVLDLLFRFQDPVVLGGEILGAFLLAILAYEVKLSSWSALRRFVLSGELPSKQNSG